MLYGDCESVVKASLLPLEKALTASHFYAGFCRQHLSYNSGKHILADIKVAAHQDVSKLQEATAVLKSRQHLADSEAVAARSDTRLRQ